MKRILYILVLVFLFSCKATQVPLSSVNAKCDYSVFIQLIDEGSNYGNAMNAVFKCPGIVEVEDNFQKSLFINTKVVKVIFKDVEDYKMFDLKNDLQKCKGIIEVSATKL